MQLNYRSIKIIAPFAFWTLRIFAFSIRSVYDMNDQSFLSILNDVKFSLTLDFITFCLFYFILAPNFFSKRRIWLTITLTLLFFIVHGFVWSLVYYRQGITIDKIHLIFISSMGHSLLNASYGVLIRLAIEWFQKREERQELLQQNAKNELALLRSQVSPHFLFNTLNNINSFTLTEPDKASFAIVKLSGIMRYMLYEAQTEKVPLSKEIDYILSFLELQRIRFADPQFIRFEHKIVECEVSISPMLFIPFIENAFKHGKKQRTTPIEIKLESVDKQIFFSCRNTKRELSKSEKEQPNGIGIVNIKRRLELLYPSKYILDIQQNETQFNVELKIDLT